jgi:hypothetical protein
MASIQKEDLLWVAYIVFGLLNAVLIDVFYIFYDGMKESDWWLHRVALNAAKEYDPLWVEAGTTMRLATGLSMFVTVWFGLTSIPSLLAGERFGHFRSNTKLVAHIYCFGAACSTFIVVLIELKETILGSALAPTYSNMAWITFSCQFIAVKLLWDRLKADDAKERKDFEEMSLAFSGKKRGSSHGFKKLAKKKLTEFTQNPRFKAKCREIFNSVDVDKSGTVDVKEVYSMVLMIYLYVAQYTTINKRTIPTVAQVEELYKKVDVDNSGTLDYDEFEAMAILEVQAVSARISTQLVCQLALAPLVASAIVKTLSDFIFVGIVYDVIKSTVHNIFWEYVFTRTIAVTLFTVLVNMSVTPFVLHVIDLIWYKEARTKDAKKLEEQTGIFAKVLKACVQYFED